MASRKKTSEAEEKKTLSQTVARKNKGKEIGQREDGGHTSWQYCLGQCINNNSPLTGELRSPCTYILTLVLSAVHF